MSLQTNNAIINQHASSNWELQWKMYDSYITKKYHNHYRKCKSKIQL